MRGIVEYLGQVAKTAVPARIVRSGEHIVVDLVIVQEIRQCFDIAVFGIGIVDRDRDIAREVPYRPTAGVIQLCHVLPTVLTRDPLSGLVADLDHANMRANVTDGFEGCGSVVVQRGTFFVDAHAAPRLGRFLLARISPKVGVMEVHQQLQAVGCRAFADLCGGVNVVVAAAVASAVRGEGIIPYAHADVVDAVVGEELEDILLRAALIAEEHTRFFQRDHRRDIHPTDEVGVFDVDRLYGDILLRRGKGDNSRRTKDGGEDKAK